MLGRYIDLGNPVADHPLNRGLVGWWLCLPGSAAGSRYFDLCGNHHGTLVNGPVWKTGRHAVLAIETSAAASSHVNCGTIRGLDGSSAATLSAWVYHPSSSVTVGLGGAAGGTGGGWRFSCYWHTDNYIYVSAESTAAAYGYVQRTETGWHHLIVAYDGAGLSNGGKLQLYFDGVAQSMSFYSAIPNSLGNPVCPFKIGQDSNNRYSGGLYSDVRIYPNRWLSASDAWLLYDQSLRGHPGTLRRYARTAYLFVSTSGTNATVTPSALNVTWAVQAPTLTAGARVSPSTGDTTWAVASPTLTADSLTAPATTDATWTVQSPTVSTSGDVTVSPTTVDITWSVQAPTLTTGSVVAPAAVDGSLALPTATIAASAVAAPAAVGPTWSSQTSTVVGAATVEPSAPGVTWSVQAPVVTCAASVAPDAAGTTWGVQAPTVAGGVDAGPDAAGATWAVQAPVVDIITDIRPGTAGVAWDVQAPDVGAGATVQAETVSLAWSLPVPAIYTLLGVVPQPVPGWRAEDSGRRWRGVDASVRTWRMDDPGRKWRARP